MHTISGRRDDGENLRESMHVPHEERKLEESRRDRRCCMRSSFTLFVLETNMSTLGTKAEREES